MADAGTGLPYPVPRPTPAPSAVALSCLAGRPLWLPGCEWFLCSENRRGTRGMHAKLPMHDSASVLGIDEQKLGGEVSPVEQLSLLSRGHARILPLYKELVVPAGGFLCPSAPSLTCGLASLRSPALAPVALFASLLFVLPVVFAFALPRFFSFACSFATTVSQYTKIGDAARKDSQLYELPVTIPGYGKAHRLSSYVRVPFASSVFSLFRLIRTVEALGYH